MKLFAAVLVLCVAFASAEYKDKTEDDFFKASADCAKKLNVPESLLEKFSKFEYPNEEIVQKHICCVFGALELWNEKEGYNAAHIAELYKDKASTEELVPIVTNCNKNPDNLPAHQWGFNGFECIFKTKLGEFFKADIAKKAAAKA